MFYAHVTRIGEPTHFWSFKFTSQKVYREAQHLLNEAKKQKRVSKYQYQWTWERWILESRKLSDYPKRLRELVKESPICQAPEEVLNRIESIHAFWDKHI